jgi:hypothetical protein
MRFVPLTLLTIFTALLALAAKVAVPPLLAVSAAHVPQPAATLAEFAPVAMASLAFGMLFFCFLMIQSAGAFVALHTKKTAAKGTADAKAPNLAQIKYGGQGGRLVLTGDRSVGNTIEQALVFLPALWLHAAYVDGVSAAWLGWLWLASRAVYPFVFYLGPPFLFLSTVPGYVFLAQLLWPVAVAVTALL